MRWSEFRSCPSSVDRLDRLRRREIDERIPAVATPAVDPRQAPAGEAHEEIHRLVVHVAIAEGEALGVDAVDRVRVAQDEAAAVFVRDEGFLDLADVRAALMRRDDARAEQQRCAFVGRERS